MDGRIYSKKFVIPLVLIMLNSVFGTTYYVKPDGNDALDGLSDANAWASMDRALPDWGGEGDKVAEGDTINVASGDYGTLDDPYKENTADTTRRDWITYVGDSDSMPILKETVFEDTGYAYLKFQYFHFKEPDTGSPYAKSVEIRGQGFADKRTTYLYFENCLFEQDNRDMEKNIKVKHADYITFDGCEFAGGKEGLALSTHYTNITISDCHFHHQWGDALDIYSSEPGEVPSDVVLEDTLFSDLVLGVLATSYHGDYIQSGGGGEMENTLDNLTIRRCTFHYNFSAFYADLGYSYNGVIFQHNGDNFTFENNLTYGMSSNAGFNITGAVSDVNIINNTLAHEMYADSGQVNIDHTCTNVKHYNNIWRVILKMEVADSNVDQDNNLYADYDNDSNGTIGTNSSEIGADAIEALFVDYDGDDLTLVSDSTAIGFGDEPEATETDILGVERDDEPDAGCYEYVGTAFFDVHVKGHLKLKGDEKKLYFYNGDYWLSFVAPSGLAANYKLVWPTDYGLAGQCLTTDGSGNLSFDDANGIGGMLRSVYDGDGDGDVNLAAGGTGASLSDPDADRIGFWDDSASTFRWLVPNTLIAISETSLNVDNDLHNYDWSNVVDGDVPDAITVTGYMQDSDIDSEGELESWLVGVTDVFTNNDGALNDDDVTAADVGGVSANLDDSDASIEWEDAADLESDGALSNDVVAVAEFLASQDWGDMSTAADGTVSLDNDVVSTAEMADADHGDFTYSGGSATLDTDSVGDNEIDYTAVNMDDMTDGSTNAAVTLTQETNWDTAYGWGDHSTQNYLDDDTADDVDDADIAWGSGAGQVDTDDVPEGSTNLYCTFATVVSECNSDFHDIGGTDDDLPDADEVTESMFKEVDGTPADEDILTYETTTGDFQWHTPSEIITAGTGIDWNGTQLDTNDSEIDHDSLSNFAANEHIDWTDASDNFDTSGSVTVGSLLRSGASSDVGTLTDYFRDGYFNDLLCVGSTPTFGIGVSSAACALDVSAAFITDVGNFRLKSPSEEHCLFVMQNTTSGKQSGFYIREGAGTGSPKWLFDHVSVGDYIRFYSYADSAVCLQLEDTREIYAPDVYNHSHGGTGRAMYIQSDGQLTCDTSSIRYKENIRPLTDTSILYLLRPVEFDWKNGGRKNDVGFIAEDVAAIDTRFVAYGQKEIRTPCSKDEDIVGERIDYVTDTSKVEAVYEQKITALLVAEIQNLRSELDTLKAEVELLKGE